MTHLALRPQPLGIFALPAGYLVLPAVEEVAELRDELLRGQIPDRAPPAARFYLAALVGNPAGALAALAGDDSPEAAYNRFVLQSDYATYLALREQLGGDLLLLLELVAYTLGWIDQPPAPGESSGELRAAVLATHAAQAFEHNDPAAAQAALVAAVEAARPVSPVFAAQLLNDLAEARLQQPAGTTLALQHLREAMSMLDGSGLREAYGQAALRLGMLYQELANGQRTPLLEAVKCYQEALRVFTREQYPELYALAQNNLALAYLAIPLTEASDQLRMAIAIQALREALQVFTRENHPERWASAQLNLANALQYLPSSHPADNLAEAVQRYEELLEARDPTGDPAGYGRLLANQGNALAHLGIFTYARPKLQEAARLFALAGDHEAAAGVREVLAELERSIAAQKEEQRSGSLPTPAI